MLAHLKLAATGLIFFIAICLGANTVTAQTPTGFSGEWMINADKTEQPEGSPKALKLIQTADTLLVTRYGTDNTSFVEKICFDGNKFVSVTTSGRSKTGTAKWEAGKQSFTENAVLGEPGNADKTAFTVVEKWTIAADGKELTVQTTLTNTAGASMTTKAIYNKR
jgi:hypothetical protein